jgi:hypothetical protein
MTAAPADRRSKERVAYVLALGLEWHTGDSASSDFYVYSWPAARNGSQYDRWVMIQEYTDGSCAIYLDANEPSFKAKCLQLRKMANPE